MRLEDIKHYFLELLIALKSLKDKGIFHRDIKPGNFLYNKEKKSGVLIDFGLAEVDKSYQIKLHKIDKNNMKKSQKAQFNIQVDLHEKLNECLDVVGRHKIGTQAFMPIESILRHQRQNYESDVWPVGVILLSFVLKKYNIFNHIKQPPSGKVQKELDSKAAYIMYYMIELATFFGREPVVKQCKKLGYLLQLPQDIPHIKVANVAQLQGYGPELEDLLFKLLQLDLDKRIKVEDAIKHSFFDTVRMDHPFKKK